MLLLRAQSQRILVYHFVGLLLLSLSLQRAACNDTLTSGLKASELYETMMVEDEDSATEKANVFEPTNEWKVVEKGQSIPPGLHVRMSLQTGLKEAKLLDEGETSTTDGRKEEVERPAFGKDLRRVNHYGKSDRRGIVNKRTKVFTKQELLETINDDSGEESQQLLITAGDDHTSNQLSPKSTEGIHVTSRDSEPNKQDTELPQTSLSDTELMLEYSRTLAKKDATISELVDALEELEYYVHEIDNAKELNEIGGLVLVVRLLNHSNPEVKSSAAHVIGSAAQSNPALQQLVLDYGTLMHLCQMISASEPDLVQRRALFALSALLRGNSEQQMIFLERCGGFRVLGDSFHERNVQVQLKVVTLLTDILTEQDDPAQSTSSEHRILLLLINQVFEHGWCGHVTSMLQSHDPNRIEKGLQAMDALKTTCDFSNQTRKLKQLAKQFQTTLETEAKSESDYTQSLLDYCRTLLKTIRQQNLDL